MSRGRRSRHVRRLSGRALAEAISFSAHALERFAERGPREIEQRDEQALRELITARARCVRARRHSVTAHWPATRP